MSSDFLSQTFAVIGAGMIESLSPCTYPMIPIVLSFLGSEKTSGRKRLVFLFFLGQVLTFTLLGILAVHLGEVFGFSSESRQVNIVLGVFLILMAVGSHFDFLPNFMSKWNNKFSHLSVKGHHRLLNAFLIGFGSALVASPCTSPILGSVLAQISQQDSFQAGVFLMVLYSFGKSFIFLGLGLGFLKAKELPKAGLWMTKVHQLTTLLIFGAGFFYLYRGIF